jgi:hypothetical protein
MNDNEDVKLWKRGPGRERADRGAPTPMPAAYRAPQGHPAPSVAIRGAELCRSMLAARKPGTEEDVPEPPF